jgi:hypothetical protein
LCGVASTATRLAAKRLKHWSFHFRRRRARRFVGETEVSPASVTSVANHPQSLWITLWAEPRRESQVPIHKGFFQFCSRIERCLFFQLDQQLTNFSPVKNVRAMVFPSARAAISLDGG